MLIASCANPLVKKKLDDDLEGNIHITSITVTGEKFVTQKVIAKMKDAIKKEVANHNVKGNKKAQLSFHINDWQQAKTGAISKVLGSKAMAKGLVIVKDEQGQTIAEYGVVADEEVGGLLSKTIAFTNAEEKLLIKVSNFVVDPLF